MDSCAEIKRRNFSGVTKSGRVWRKVQESDARSVINLYSDLSEGADSAGGQMRGDKECPSSSFKLLKKSFHISDFRPILQLSC